MTFEEFKDEILQDYLLYTLKCDVSQQQGFRLSLGIVNMYNHYQITEVTELY